MASVAFDSASSAEQVLDGNDLEFSHTVGDHNKRLLVVLFSASFARNPSYIRFGGVDLTKVYDLGSYSGEVWILKNPSVGTDTVSIELSGITSGNYGWGTAISFYNVSQFSPIRGIAQDSGTGGGNTSVDIDSKNTEFVLDFYMASTWTSSWTVGSGQTSRSSHAKIAGQHRTSTEPGADSVTMSWIFGTGSGSPDWLHFVIALRQSRTQQVILL